MQKQTIELVEEFTRISGHPIANKPTIPALAVVQFRINFIKEELAELEKAIAENDLVEVADGLGDIQYVLDGFFLNCGMHSIKDEILAEIHRSNMTKFCDSMWSALESKKALTDKGTECTVGQVGDKFAVCRKADGKVQKPLTYEAPDLASIVASAGQPKAPGLPVPFADEAF